MPRGCRRWTGSKSPLPPWWGASAARRWWQCGHTDPSHTTPPLLGSSHGGLSGNKRENKKQRHARSIFQRREQRLPSLRQGNEPSRGSGNQSSPYRDGALWRTSPAWCPTPLHPLQAPLPLPQPLSPSQSPGAHPWPLVITPTLASRLEKPWGKELQRGTETATLKPL